MRSLRTVRVLVLLVASSALISGSIDAGAAAVSKDVVPSAPTLPKGIAVAPNTLIALQQARATGQPVIVADQYGVGRYLYAHPGCEFGRSE